jgi:hypothetical protein
MSAVAILGILTGIVLAWGFRVWILLPVTLAVFLATSVFLLASNHSFLGAVGTGFLVSLLPQLGYFVGLLTRYMTIVLRSSRDTATNHLKKLDSVEY